MFHCTLRRMYTASTDKTIGVWDMTTGEKIKKLKGKIHDYRQADHNRQNEVKWDLNIGIVSEIYIFLLCFLGHQTFVNSCDVARRGPQVICSGSDDGTVRVRKDNEHFVVPYSLIVLSSLAYLTPI